MTSTTIEIKSLFPHLCSRHEGALLREAILQALEKSPKVVLDFSDVLLTPSFVDESIGLLSQHMSLQILKERVKMVHLSQTNQALLLRVIANRFRLPT